MKRTYSKERMTNLAILVSMIQAALYLSFVAYFLEIFLRDVADPEQLHRLILKHLTSNVYSLFVALLFFAGVFHLAWLVSSIYALIGNRDGNKRSVSQYLVITVLVCLMDIIFPFIVLPTTYTVFKMSMKSQSFHDARLEESILMKEADYGHYFWLVMTFIRGGCFTFAIDVLSAVVAYKRFQELDVLGIKVEGNPGMAGKGGALDDDLDRRSSEVEHDLEEEEEEGDERRDRDRNEESGGESIRETITYVPPENQQPPRVGIEDETRSDRT